MDISKVTTKYQATIPLEIRNFLGLKKGDAVNFHIEDDKVVLNKANPMDWEFSRLAGHGLSEWNSSEDDEAFRDL